MNVSPQIIMGTDLSTRLESKLYAEDTRPRYEDFAPVIRARASKYVHNERFLIIIPLGVPVVPLVKATDIKPSRLWRHGPDRGCAGGSFCRNFFKLSLTTRKFGCGNCEVSLYFVKLSISCEFVEATILHSLFCG